MIYLWQEDIDGLLTLKNVDDSQIKNITIPSSDFIISKNNLNFHMRKVLIEELERKKDFILTKGLIALNNDQIDNTGYDMFYVSPANTITNQIFKILKENYNYFTFECKASSELFFIDNYNAQYLYNRRNQKKSFYIEYAPVSLGHGRINKVLFLTDYNRFKEKRYFI